MNIEFEPAQLKDQPPGTAMFVPVKSEGDPMRNFSWVIRMESSKIEELKKLPEGGIQIQQRTGYYCNEFDGREIGVLDVLTGVSISGDFNENTIYEAFCNEFADKVGGASATLTTQQIMPFILYGDSKTMEHSFASVVFPNTRVLAQQATAHVARLDYEWTADEFEICKQDLIANYPTKMERWNLFES